MRFAEPFWLLVGAVVVGLLLVLRARGEYLTARAIDALAGARLIEKRALPSRLRRWLRVAAVSFAVAMGFVALARPQKGMQWQTVDREGTDLLLVVDTSKSMNADDVRPTRLERTKLAVRDLVERFPGDRIGLVAFAGDAFVESPMTLDHDALLETLRAFDTSIIARGGTDIGRAIDIGSAALKADSSDQKVMVLLTDGEDLESNGLEAAKRAGAAGITIETVGVGTPAGELIPAKNDQGATVGLVRDDSGTPVRSRLDEASLRAIAQAGHGTYRPLGADGRGLDRLYAEALAPLSHTERGARVRRVYAERFAVPLALSIFGVVLDALLGWKPRARGRAGRSPGARNATRAGAIAAVALTILLPGRARASVQEAEKAYAAGRFDDSAREYEAERASHPRDARLAIDAGAAAYRAGHYEAAEAALKEALTSADPKLQQQVLYDLGDARYRLGAATLADAPETTKERWKAAIDAYEGALALAPSDADARYNRDLVKRQLAELENKQKQQPQEKQSKKDGDSQGASKDAASKDGSTKDGAKDAASKDGSSKDGAGKTSKDAAGKNGGASDNATGGASPSRGDPADCKPGQSGPQGQAPSAERPGDGSRDTSAPGASDARREPANGDGHGAGAAGDRPDQGKEPAAAGASTGKLSARDARALLDSLRGDERRGVSSGTSGSPAPTDSPRRDW